MRFRNKERMAGKQRPNIEKCNRNSVFEDNFSLPISRRDTAERAPGIAACRFGSHTLWHQASLLHKSPVVIQGQPQSGLKQNFIMQFCVRQRTWRVFRQHVPERCTRAMYAPILTIGASTSANGDYTRWPAARTSSEDMRAMSTSDISQFPPFDAGSDAVNVIAETPRGCRTKHLPTAKPRRLVPGFSDCWFFRGYVT